VAAHVADRRLVVLPLPGTPLDRPWHLVGGRRASRATTLLVDHVLGGPDWEPPR
jgi:LysR family transcriptional regulator, low CO2-responsive transcriptional regulator